MKQEFIDIITGGASIATILGCLFFAFVGAVINILIKVLKRDKTSERTPIDFQWKFFVSDNFVRFILSSILNITVVFVCLRFSKDLFNTDLNPLFGLVTGLTFDGLVGKLTDYIKKSK